MLSSGRFALPAANAVLDAVPPEMGHARPQVGHVYVARIVAHNSPKEDLSKRELLVKLLIVGLHEENEVAFEWERLGSP